MISHHHLISTSILSFIFVSSISASPHIFPNVSAIPPSFIPNATHGTWQGFMNFSGCHPGERMDGLAKLKYYFSRFGYINNSSNFTDVFDETLESAVKTYQENFNLNVTGWLDGPTMSQIVRPRCGVADIINGSNSMNSGRTTSQLHTVAHYTYFDGEPRWTKSNLTYAFLPGNNLSDTVKKVFASAFDRWATVIPLTFTETDSYLKADIRVGFFTGDHGDGEAFDGALGTLAHSFSPPSGIFHLDGDENWVLDVDSASSTASSSAVDLESVAVHEIGHLLGLGHTSVDEAIMYPTLSADTRKVELASDDIEGVQNLYGSNPNYNGSTTTTSQGKDTNGGRSYFVHSFWDLRMLISVVFVLLIL